MTHWLQAVLNIQIRLKAIKDWKEITILFPGAHVIGFKNGFYTARVPHDR